MGLVNIRELLAFPQGDNSSDTLIGGIHWNLTTLEQWNYTYYSNGTFSNGSLCFVIFEPYTPYLLANGTFLNSTSCYSPIDGLGSRSKIGLFFACFFAASIMFTFVNLRKHGRMFLPVEKRFRAIGRRWQWYWMLAVAAFGMISAFTGIDVDRYYLPQLPIVLSNFAWFLMLPTTMGAVWEGVRHWGSWQERQMIDPNPFVLKQDDRRSKVEFWLPLFFYFFAWMVLQPSLFNGIANECRTSSWSFRAHGGKSSFNATQTKLDLMPNPQQQTSALSWQLSSSSPAGSSRSSPSTTQSNTIKLEIAGSSIGSSD
jgi:hypothetical protein